MLIRQLIAHNFRLVLPFLKIAPVVFFFGLLMTGVGLVFFKSKQLNKFYLFISPYLGINLTVLVFWVGLRFTSEPVLLSKFLSVTLATLAIFQIYQKRNNLKKIISQHKNRSFWLGLGLTVVSLFLLFNLTYQNGMHDEYFHYPVLSAFFENQAYPFINPLKAGSNINKTYHIGLYYFVILIKTISRLPLEISLDVAKFVMLLPINGLLIAWFREQFRLSWLMMGLVAVSIFFAGPSLFGVDQLTLNYLGIENQGLLHTSNFFELAGITWHGLLFALATWALAWRALIGKKLDLDIWQVRLMLAISLFSLFLINRAFFGVTLVNLMAFYLIKKIKHFLPLFNKLLLITIIALIPIMASCWAAECISTPVVIWGKFQLRDTLSWGFPYQSESVIGPLAIDNNTFLRQVGLIPLISFIMAAVMIYKKKYYSLTSLFLINFLAFFVSIYFLGYQNMSSFLALNKFYRWAYLIQTMYIGIISADKSLPIWFKTILWSFLIFSWSPLLYLSTTGFTDI